MKSNRPLPGDLVVFKVGQPMRNKPEFMYDSETKPELWYVQSKGPGFVIASFDYVNPLGTYKGNDDISWHCTIIDNRIGWFFVRQYEFERITNTFKIIAKIEER